MAEPPLRVRDPYTPLKSEVPLYAEDVVPAASDDDLRGLSLGVHRVCNDDPARKGNGCEQRSESKNLIRLLVLDVALTDHHSGVVTKRCQQLDLGTICSLRTSHRLAIDRYANEVCPDTTTTVGVGGVAVVLDIRRCRARVYRCPPPAICLFNSREHPRVWRWPQPERGGGEMPQTTDLLARALRLVIKPK